MERVVYILCFFIFSCSPSKKIARIVAKHPCLQQTVDTTIYFTTNNNTIVYRDLDTSVLTESKIDSVIVAKQIIKIPKEEPLDINSLLKLTLFLVHLPLLHTFVAH